MVILEQEPSLYGTALHYYFSDGFIRARMSRTPAEYETNGRVDCFFVCTTASHDLL